ncbi:MAG TPA: hypothetical protein VEY88_24475, partial [Archangium sp.]|nr:hypothetical protein [Archangium sp.]
MLVGSAVLEVDAVVLSGHWVPPLVTHVSWVLGALVVVWVDKVVVLFGMAFPSGIQLQLCLALPKRG